jgi:hypothetical protein
VVGDRRWREGCAGKAATGGRPAQDRHRDRLRGRGTRTDRTINITTTPSHSAPENAGAQPSAPSASSASIPKSNSTNGFAAEPLRTVAAAATLPPSAPPLCGHLDGVEGRAWPQVEPCRGRASALRLPDHRCDRPSRRHPSQGDADDPADRTRNRDLDDRSCGRSAHASAARARRPVARDHNGPSRAAVAASRFRFGAAIGCSSSDPVISISSMSSDA